MVHTVTYKNIEARRFGDTKTQATISNNSTLTAVSGEGDKFTVDFVFSCNYEPNIGVIRLEGELMIKESKDNIERALSEWKKSGKRSLPKDIAEKVHNKILGNCLTEATVISRDIRLPAPFPHPKVSLGGDGGDTSYIR